MCLLQNHSGYVAKARHRREPTQGDHCEGDIWLVAAAAQAFQLEPRLPGDHNVRLLACMLKLSARSVFAARPVLPPLHY